MPCFHPLEGFKSTHVNPSGKRSIVFKAHEGFSDLRVKLPCGRCIGCRLEKSRQWAVRCMHEASLYEDNCFITLTYSDEYLPEDGSLNKKHFQDFMKRLRKRFGEGIRYYHCGEYGEKFKRPHYHACLFNFDFKDKEFFKEKNGSKLFTSKSLNELWPFGHCLIGSVTFESAAYVARYIMKKQTGPKAKAAYETYDRNTGEVYELHPEYQTMSRRPGIGRPWFDKFKDDVYPADSVIVREKEVRPPKYYDYLFEIDYPSDFDKVKRQRKINGLKFAENSSPERLAVRETVQELKIKKLIRSYENNG